MHWRWAQCIALLHDPIPFLHPDSCKNPLLINNKYSSQVSISQGETYITVYHVTSQNLISPSPSLMERGLGGEARFLLQLVQLTDRFNGGEFIDGKLLNFL